MLEVDQRLQIQASVRIPRHLIQDNAIQRPQAVGIFFLQKPPQEWNQLWILNGWKGMADVLLPGAGNRVGGREPRCRDAVPSFLRYKHYIVLSSGVMPCPADPSLITQAGSKLEKVLRLDPLSV